MDNNTDLLCLDISSKNLGIAGFNKKRDLVYVNYIDIRDYVSGLALDNLWAKAKFLDDLIKTKLPKGFTKMAIEMSPIPGYTGRVLHLYVGMVLGLILANSAHDVEYKIVNPSVWQPMRFKVISNKTKEQSIEAAFYDFPQWREPIEKNFPKIDDITDAINMGIIYDKLPITSKNSVYQDWKKKEENGR